MASDRTNQAAIKTIKTNSLNRRLLKQQSIAQRVHLETVLGLTVTSNAGLAVHPSTGTIAYTAGCVVVLLDPVTDSQQHLIVPNKRTLSAVAFSNDGRYFASGECGQQPCLRIWDAKDHSQICELVGHKNGVTHVAFSSDSKYLISVGTHHDNLVILWDWRNSRKVASNKVTCKVKGVAFAEDNSFIVTAGNRHVKYWYLEHGKDSRADVVPLVGRSAVLGDYKDECFLDVVCGKGACAEYTYAVTQSGYLCQFNSRRSLEKMISLQSAAGQCISAGESGIVVGCSNGSVRVYDPTMLSLLASLPLPHQLGVDLARFTRTDHLSQRYAHDAVYPDCVALAFDEDHERITVIHSDHSIYVWDVRDAQQTTKLCSHLYHSRCVWGIEVYAPTHASKSTLPLPIGSFLSCSSDDTVRIWNATSSRDTSDPAHRNLFCSFTHKIIYSDPSLQYLCNKENNPGGVDPLDVHADSKYGIRCLRTDPFGEQLAFGDRLGHIHIYDLSTMREAYKIEAHDSEVLCLEYSKPDSGYELLASASRDRLIQIFDVKNDYDCLQTLDDHSSSITALRFATLNGARQFGLISCGVDKAVILRTIQYSTEGGPKFLLNDQILSKGGVVYDMDVDTNSQSIITANQDRQLRFYGIKSRKLEKTIKGAATDEGALIKLDLHDSGRFIATSCSDKNLAIIDAISGDCWAAFSGHSEIVTGLKFDKHDSSLISVSGDGVAIETTVSQMKTLVNEPERLQLSLSPMNSIGSVSEISISGSEALDEELQEILRPTNFPLNTDPLPGWAKARETKQLNSPSGGVTPRLRGRWADEMDQVFLQDDLVGETTDSDIFTSSPTETPAALFSMGNPRPNLLSTTSSSAESAQSGSSLKKSHALFIPYGPDPTDKSRPAVQGRLKRLNPANSAANEQMLRESRQSPIQQSIQPSILGFLGGQKRPNRDELDDNDEGLHASKACVVRQQSDLSIEHRESPELLPDLESLSTSNSNVSTSSPFPSRPETPSDAVNKFLNLSAAGIDKVLRSRLPHRQSITIKHQQPPTSFPVTTEPPSEDAATVVKSVVPISPSKKLIQNARLSTSRQKFKSTQNLVTVPLTAFKTEEERNDQDALQEMRRATSMTNLHSGDPKDRSGLDGYNSLLERAKARISTTSTKPKSDAVSPSPSRNNSVLKPPTVLNSLSDFSSSKGDVSPSDNGDDVGGRSRDRRPFYGHLPLPTLSTRGRSSERSGTPSAVKKPLENGSVEDKDAPSIRTILERRARDNSASRTSLTGPLLVESPTAVAIARIKAEIGLGGKSNGSNGASVHSLDMSLDVCRNQCRNLTIAVDRIVNDLRNIVEDVGPSQQRNDILSVYEETFKHIKGQVVEAINLVEKSSRAIGECNQSSAGEESDTSGASLPKRKESNLASSPSFLSRTYR